MAVSGLVALALYLIPVYFLIILIALYEIFYHYDFGNPLVSQSSDSDNDNLLERFEAGELRDDEKEKLEVFLFEKRDESKYDYQKECVICLNNFEAGNLCLGVDKCNNMYHKDCMGIWLKIKTVCPLCRRVVHPAAST